MTKKYFGTDGIRGVVGEMPITPEFILKLGWAAGKVFARQGETRVLIGKDTRISGYMFESALEAGLAAAGVDVRLLGPMPTPAIAYLTRTFGAAAGIVISASHNPYHDNGIKFFSSEGQKLPDDIELAIEKQLDESIKVVPPEQVGKAARIIDARGRYIEFCKGTISKGLSLKGLRIVVDCANGACYDIAPSVLDELGAEVIAIGCDPDGININLDCGSTKPAALQQKVIESRADLGIALDGDGDRLVMVDAQGRLIDGDQILYIMTKDLVDRGKFKGGVVGTLMTNLGMELALKSMDIPFVRANVGDRYVMEELLKNQWTLGGESSGHLICLNHTTTGDGIVAAMQVLAAVVRSGKPLAELASGMEMYPQTMVNVHLAEKVSVDDIPAVQEAVAKATTELDGKGRVLLRPSGTEPLIRVMVEGEDGSLVEKLANEIASVVEKAVGGG